MSYMIHNPGDDRIEMPNGESIPRITVTMAKHGLGVEKRGMKLSGKVNCTKLAKRWLKLKTRDRDKLIAGLVELLEERTTE